MQITFWSILAEGQEQVQESGGYDMRTFVFIGCILALSLFLLAKTRRRVARSQKTKGVSVRDRVDELQGPKDVYDQVNELMARLADLSRQINGQIDTRLARLEIMLRQADETIKNLEELSGTEIEREVISPPERDDPGSQEILQLAEEGLSAVAIAQRIGRPVGEVELILALRGGGRQRD